MTILFWSSLIGLNQYKKHSKVYNFILTWVRKATYQLSNWLYSTVFLRAWMRFQSKWSLSRERWLLLPFLKSFMIGLCLAWVFGFALPRSWGKAFSPSFRHFRSGITMSELQEHSRWYTTIGSWTIHLSHASVTHLLSTTKFWTSISELKRLSLTEKHQRLTVEDQ